MITIDYDAYKQEIGYYKLAISHQSKSLKDFIQMDDGYVWEEIQVQESEGWLGTSEFTDVKSIIFKSNKNIVYQIMSPNLSKEEMIKELESI